MLEEADNFILSILEHFNEQFSQNTHLQSLLCNYLKFNQEVVKLRKLDLIFDGICISYTMFGAIESSQPIDVLWSRSYHGPVNLRHIYKISQALKQFAPEMVGKIGEETLTKTLNRIHAKINLRSVESKTRVNHFTPLRFRVLAEFTKQLDRTKAKEIADLFWVALLLEECFQADCYIKKDTRKLVKNAFSNILY